MTNNLTVVGPHGTNATVDCTINPIPVADLFVIKLNDFDLIIDIFNPIDCHNKDTVKWYISVINDGPDTAVNAIATDILPEGLIYITQIIQLEHTTLKPVYGLLEILQVEKLLQYGLKL